MQAAGTRPGCLRLVSCYDCGVGVPRIGRGNCALLLAAALLSIVACRRERAAPPAPRAPAAPPIAAPTAVPAVPVKPAPAKRPKTESFSQGDVYALVERWLDAQNRGDFAAYERLYARELRGTKRVGQRVTVMDRAAWMADRGRMFEKPMVVVGHERVVRISGVYALVELTQRFSQGKFMDRGRKQLLLTPEDGGLRILEEEMMSSELAANGERLGERFLPFVRMNGKPYVMIRAGADRAWGAGPFTFARETAGMDIAYLRAADRERTPDSATWLARALRVYDAAGASCSAKIVDLQLYAGAVGNFHTDEEEQHLDDLGACGDACGHAAFERQGPSLLGLLDGCDGVFAQPAELPAPTFYPPEPVAPDVEQRALAAARALPFYDEKQRELVAQLVRAGDTEAEAQAFAAAHPWDEGDGASGFGSGDKHFVVVQLTADGCGTVIYAALRAVYELAADGSLQLLNPDVDGPEIWPSLLLDLDKDGQLELLTGENSGLDQALYGIQRGAIGHVNALPYYRGSCGC